MISKYADLQVIEKYRNMEFAFPAATLERSVILVPGGCGGLGSALVALLLIEGAVPVVGYRSNRERALIVKARLESLYGGQIHLVEGDLTKLEDRRNYIRAASQIGGSIDGFACFAGDPARISLEAVQAENLATSFQENFIGPIMMAKEVAEHMISRGIKGSLVLLSSMQAVAAYENSLSYAAPKSSLIHACRVLARQWSGKHGVRFNVVAPGATLAGMAAASVSAGKYDRYIDEKSIQRFGRPEDIAKAVRFLLDPDNYVTGQVITVDGGLTLRS